MFVVPGPRDVDLAIESFSAETWLGVGNRAPVFLILSTGRIFSNWLSASPVLLCCNLWQLLLVVAGVSRGYRSQYQSVAAVCQLPTACWFDRVCFGGRRPSGLDGATMSGMQVSTFHGVKIYNLSSGEPRLTLSQSIILWIMLML